MKKLFLVPLLFFALPAFSQTCSPFMGISNVQFLDNLGQPLTNGALYSFQSGTSTQQATFSDPGCTVANTNPITFTTGGRAIIWLQTASVYKFVLCSSSTDGPSCAAGDTLAVADQVPGGVTGGGGGGGSPFISGSANPATSGILRLSSGDSVCWRNTANSSNLCFSKDSNDLLLWAGGNLKLPEVGTPTSVAGFDILNPNSTAHRFEQCSNGSACAQLVNAGVDVNTSDQVTQLHFGSTATPLSGTAPTTNQFLKFDGTNIVGVNLAAYNTPSASTNASIGSTTMATAGSSGNKYLFNAYILQTVTGSGCTTNSTIGLNLNYTDAQTSLVVSFGLLGVSDPLSVGPSLSPPLGSNNGVAGGQSIAWFPVAINAKASTTVSYSTTFTAGSCTTAPSYYVIPVLQLIG